MIERGGGDRARQFAWIVAQDAEIGHGGAEALQQSGKQIAVGIVERSTRQRRPGFDDLIAGRKQRHPHAAAHIEFGETERRGERHMLHRKPPPRRQRDRAGADVLAGEPPVGAALQARRHHHAIAVDAAIFLHEHRIRALRHRRAGEDADRLAGLDGMVRRVPGSDPIDNAKARVARGSEVLGTHRITIDGGIIERRYADRCNKVLRQHTAVGFAQRDALTVLDWRDAFGDQTLGLGDRQQRTVKGETVVAELRHQASLREVCFKPPI